MVPYSFDEKKVHSTTLVRTYCTSFNLQPQNQLFNTHRLSEPSDLHPSTVFKVVFAYVAPTSLIFFATTYLGPHVTETETPPSSQHGAAPSVAAATLTLPRIVTV
jgi:hypothetical protein